MNYEELEDFVVGTLDIEGAEVKALPHLAALNTPRDTKRPVLYVILHGGTLDEPENLAVTSQLESIRGEVFMCAKDRRGDMGIFDLYEKITAKLLGVRIPGTKHAITFDQFDYVAGIQNNWQYALGFSFTAYRIESDKKNDDPLMKQITNNVEVR